MNKGHGALMLVGLLGFHLKRNETRRSPFQSRETVRLLDVFRDFLTHSVNQLSCDVLGILTGI